MSLPTHRGVALAALLVLLPCPAPAAMPPGGERDLPRAEADESSRLVRFLEPLDATQRATLALPEARAKAREALVHEWSRQGRGADEAEALATRLIDELGSAVSPAGSFQEPRFAIGPFELSLAELRRVVGQREGRDRHEVTARLRLMAPLASASLDESTLLSLVPELVAADERASLDALLARMSRALLQEEAEQ